MVSSLLLNPFDWIADFFKALFDIIPKVMYLLYASLACVLDVLQLFFRKLAGLDVYYTKIDGKMVAVSGDIVTNFITGILQPFLPGIDKNGNTYPILSTVFWAMIIFGLIICFACTIVAIIKSHYTYDDKAAKGPMQYVYTAGKAVINMIAVPIIVVLGLWVSEGVLTALDTITSVSSGSVAAKFDTDLLESVYTSKSATEDSPADSKERTYIYYDIFGFGAKIYYGKETNPPLVAAPWDKNLTLIGSSNQTFSGSLFRSAAYNANRARNGQMSLNYRDAFAGARSGEIFANAEDDEDLAEMIDTAFACHLHLKDKMDLKYISSESDGNGVWISLKYFTNFLCQSAKSFSKFNVGLVWYYYDLWQFNFIVGFAGVIVCASIFINIVLGLMTRLVMSVGLFLIAPPLFGLAPLDGGEAGKNWRKNFMEQILMAYGSVVGMNIVLLILPYLNEIKFFNIPIADYFATTLFIIVGLITIKAFIAVVSKLVGGADANKTGGDIAKEVGTVAGKATKMTYGAAKLGAKAWGATARTAGWAAATGGRLVQSGAHLVGAGAVATKGAFLKARGNAKAKALERDRAAAEAEANKYGSLNSLFKSDGNWRDGANGSLATAAQMMKSGASREEVMKSLTSGKHKLSASQAEAAYDLLGDVKIKGKGKNAQIDSASFREAMSKRHEAAQGKAREIADRQKTLREQGSAQFGIAKQRLGKAGESAKKAGASAKMTGKAAWKGATGVGIGAGKWYLDSSDTVYKGNDAYSEFKQKSFWRDEDYTKTTAANTASMSASASRQAAIQEWQARHPGQAMTDKDVDEIDGRSGQYEYNDDGSRGDKKAKPKLGERIKKGASAARESARRYMHMEDGDR